MALVEENAVISQPQHGFLRALVFLLTGLVLGVCITVGIEYWLLRSGALESAFQTYFLSTTFSEAQNSQATTTQVKTLPTIIASSTIAVPKAYATQQYTDALNASVSSLKTIVVQSAQIGGLFQKIRTQVSSGNLNGTFDLILNAKTILAEQQVSIEQFGQHITELEAANQSTNDLATKSFTIDLLSKGKVLQGDLLSYNTVLGGLLSGSIPTPSQVTAAGVQATRVETEAKAFVDSSNELFGHFGSVNNPAKK